MLSLFLQEVKSLKNGKNVINLGIGQPDFPTPKNIVNAAIKALKDGHHGYTSSNGIFELREAITEDFFNRNNVEIDPNNILITPGGKSIIFYTLLMFGQPGSEIISPDPGFIAYKSMIDYTGATLYHFLTGWKIIFHLMLKNFCPWLMIELN